MASISDHYKGVFLSTVSSMDVHSVILSANFSFQPPSTEWTCRVYPLFPFHNQQ